MKDETTEVVLSARVEVPIRFSEVDSLRVVWHGHYLRYFEDGREAFGTKFDLEYLDIYEKDGYALPLVKEIVEHKRPLKYGDKAIVETTFVNSPAAKIIFRYQIFRESDGLLAATGETTQVFVDREGLLSFIVPEFFNSWKMKNSLA